MSQFLQIYYFFVKNANNDIYCMNISLIEINPKSRTDYVSA